MSDYKLGKQPFRSDPSDLHLRNYLNLTVLPPLPATFGHLNLIPTGGWGMLGNDMLGDCTIAGALHATMAWCAEGAGQDVTGLFTKELAVDLYSAITGYSPNRPGSDQGALIRDIIDFQINQGMPDTNHKVHKIAAKLLIDHRNIKEVLYAMYLFGDVELGIQVPSSAQQQFREGKPWMVVPGDYIEGGHDVPAMAFDGEYINVVTWGSVQRMSFDFFRTYCDEAWVKLSPDMLNGQGLSPEGFNLAQLQADLNVLNGVSGTISPAAAPVVGAKEIVIQIGAATMNVDGVNVALDQPAEIDSKTGRTLLPVRALSANMGYTVAWDATTQTITMIRNS